MEGIKEKICRIEEENLTLHQILVSRSAELWDNLERLRQLGESIRDHKGMLKIIKNVTKDDEKISNNCFEAFAVILNNSPISSRDMLLHKSCVQQQNLEYNKLSGFNLLELNLFLKVFLTIASSCVTLTQFSLIPRFLQ